MISQKNKLFIKSNNQSLKTNPTQDEKYFIVSKILDGDFSNQDFINLAEELFKQLPFSELQWKNRENLFDLQQSYQKLLSYEKKWYQKGNQKFNEEFAGFFNKKTFENIEQIENAAKKSLERMFEFDWVLFGDEQTRKEIVIFYNFLISSKIFKKNQLIKLLISIYQNASSKITAMGEVEGFFVGDNLNSVVLQKMNLSILWNNEKINMDRFTKGQSVSPNSFKTFVHEFGHIVHNFYSLSYEIKLKLNQNIDGTFKWDSELALEKFLMNKGFAKKSCFQFGGQAKFIVAYAHDYMISQMQDSNLIKKGHDIYYQTYVTFARWVSMPSSYGRKEKFSDIYARKFNLGQYYEWFAEGFAYWYLTPIANQNQIWEYWHNLFVHELPKKFNS